MEIMDRLLRHWGCRKLSNFLGFVISDIFVIIGQIGLLDEFRWLISLTKSEKSVSVDYSSIPKGVVVAASPKPLFFIHFSPLIDVVGG